MRSVTGSGSADAQLPISSHIPEEEPEGGLSGRLLHQDVHHDSPCGFMMCFPIMILWFNASLSAPAPAALLCTGKVNGEGVHPSGLKPALPA